MVAHDWPVVCREEKYREGQVGQILLNRNSFVGGDQHVELARRNNLEQFAILYPLAANDVDRQHLVANDSLHQRMWHALIQQYFHEGNGWRGIAAELRCDRYRRRESTQRSL